MKYCIVKSEVWKDIPGYDGAYQISNYGRVRSIGRSVKGHKSLRFLPTRLKKKTVNAVGYEVVGLWKDNKQMLEYIHRLVAEAFIENPENKPAINHVDGNKLNNDLSNLEWCTTAENMRHAFRIGLVPLSKPVKCVETGIIYSSLSDAAEDISGKRRDQTSVGAVARGVRNHWHGYHFKFVERLES